MTCNPKLSPRRRSNLLLAMTTLLGTNMGWADSGRVAMTTEEILAYGGDPSTGSYYKLPPSPWLDNADMHLKGSASTVGYASQVGIDFRPMDFRQNFSSFLGHDLYCQEGNESRAESQLQMPQGAAIRFLRIYVDDTNATQNITVSLIERCQATNSASNVTTTVLGSITSAGSPGKQTGSIGFGITNPVVDNLNCLYVLRAQLGNSAFACVGPNLSIDKARIEWQL